MLCPAEPIDPAKYVSSDDVDTTPPTLDPQVFIIGGVVTVSSDKVCSGIPDAAAHFSTATATASLYFLSAWYCSALPPRCIFLHICLWPRRQWSIWQVLLQYLTLHLTQRGASWASGAAQAAQVVRIILIWLRRLRGSRGCF